MACSLCDDDEAGACIERALVYNARAGEGGEQVVTTDPVPYGAEPMYDGWMPSMRCAGCGVTAGSYHHDGCEFEICPICGEQLVECPCNPGVTSRDHAGIEFE